MARIFAIVDGKEITERGFVLFKPDQSVEIFPFDGDAEFRIIFRVIDTDRNRSKTDREAKDENTFEVLHHRNYFEGRSSSNLSNDPFAGNDTHDYFFHFTLQTIGSSMKFMYQINYIVLRNKKS